MKKLKKIIIVGIVSILLANTIAFAAQTDLYTIVRNSILAVKETILKRDSALEDNGDDAIQRLDEFVTDYKVDLQIELEKYEEEKNEEAAVAIEQEIDTTIQQLEDEKKVLIEEAKKEIDTKIQKDLDNELTKIRKHFKSQ